MVSEKEQKLALAGALSDQVWASLREHFADIERIAWSGPAEDNDSDDLLVRKVFLAVGGDLHRKAAELRREEELD